MKRLRSEMLVAVLVGTASSAQTTQRASVDSAGAQANSGSYSVSLSADGRFAAFVSRARNLVPGDSNGKLDVFVHDRRNGRTERVSVDSNGMQADGDSGYYYGSAPSISADGRYVAYTSSASNLISGDTNGEWDVFVRDRRIGTTERVSIASNGAQGDATSGGTYVSLSLSADGHCVAFVSWATNLVAGDTNGLPDVFVHDLRTGATERVSVDSSGVQGNGASGVYANPSMSADGRFVAFRSYASNLVTGDTNGQPDIFVRDRRLGSTERISVSSSGREANETCWSPSISADGRWVAFSSTASNLVVGDVHGDSDVFIRDRATDTTILVSGFYQTDVYSPSISADGRMVAFQGYGVSGAEVFVHDGQSGWSEWASLNLYGDSSWSDGDSHSPSISADSRYVAFASDCTLLVWGDTNSASDIFVHEIPAHSTSSLSLCHPGSLGVITCPCSNPPFDIERGCDNSSATGGASLWTSGCACLGSDSLVFTTSAEPQAVFSILLQGSSVMPGGAVYGQGVRCIGGSLRRLYSKTASLGRMIAPDLSAGDPTVHARSAALGDPIEASSSRWYTVIYRDPVVLGGCPATSTFNSTQTREVFWFL